MFFAQTGLVSLNVSDVVVVFAQPVAKWQEIKRVAFSQGVFLR